MWTAEEVLTILVSATERAGYRPGIDLSSATAIVERFRLAKYNRLIRIEERLGAEAQYGAPRVEAPFDSHPV